ncbi:type II toxin-antitoxin system VapC family toxin [Glaciecola petra]|uniref:Type II toxin-antitoxin system VapC family toxin n=1 Tax=Glaciecola petra TaxID=3075602 RepID=A0ABU2ZTX9_9ALTE|nr:type II toxin-antitoxin system VapC family toxin [Aestuariibacter sp. P117]MDT0596050.1 type II toxin-antitoxin system VapC family toxin [Aestuariibacter sp. P117]
MKRVLLDTHALLWWLNGNQQLGKNSIETISNQDNDIFVSAASIWEIAIKKKKGLLEAPDDFDSIITEEGFKHLPISSYHAEQAGELELHHKDPFDRMLVAQAQAEGLILMTNDNEIPKYSVKVINAND